MVAESALAATDDGPHVAIVGRHAAADIRFEDPALSVRQLLLASWLSGRREPCSRIVDLRSSLAFSDEWGTRLSGLTSEWLAVAVALVAGVAAASFAASAILESRAFFALAL